MQSAEDLRQRFAASRVTGRRMRDVRVAKPGTVRSRIRLLRTLALVPVILAALVTGGARPAAAWTQGQPQDRPFPRLGALSPDTSTWQLTAKATRFDYVVLGDTQRSAMPSLKSINVGLRDGSR